MLKQLGADISEQLSWVSDYSSSTGKLDVERMLTNLDLELQSAEPDSSIYNLLTTRRKDLTAFISRRLRLDSIPEATLKSATELCLNLLRPGDFVVTFNWDCLLEKVLWQADIWNPLGGYGDSMSLPLYSESGTINPFFIKILKLHGSVNFAPTTYSDEYLTLFEYGEIFPGMKEITVQGSPGPETLPVVTLPTYIKRFGEHKSLNDIWANAAEALRNVETLVVIGYSFPAADVLARMLLANVGKEKRVNRIAILSGSDLESRGIQSRIRSVASLPSDRYSDESEHYEENVEWNLLEEKGNGAGFRHLLDVLNHVPSHDITRAILARASLKTDLIVWRRLQKLQKPAEE
jgi:hypothetical protein